MKEIITIQDIAELAKLKDTKLFSDSNTSNINIVEFFKEKYTINNYNFKESYYEKTKTENYTNNDISKFSDSNISNKEFLIFVKNHYNLLLTNYRHNRAKYNTTNKICEEIIKRKNYTLVKRIAHNSDVIIKTNKFDYFVDDTNKLIVVTRVLEDISEQELKKLVFAKSSPIFNGLNLFNRKINEYKKGLDDLEQSINFIKTNYSELII